MMMSGFLDRGFRIGCVDLVGRWVCCCLDYYYLLILFMLQALFIAGVVIR